MTNSELPVVARVADDREAAMVVALLAAHGIEALAEGTFTADFRAEAPGRVAVRVRGADWEAAREILASTPAGGGSDPADEQG
ncbi:MAG: DUF2007 domain-containing protein [Pirellulales bacterium]|nr:DUF2007 domain-containing protein [Pirellulales bacterium]